MKLGIIGLGLIGGSIAKDARTSGFASTIVGYDKNKQHINEALSLGLIDNAETIANMNATVDLIIVAIPVDVARNVVVDLLNQESGIATITDVGSTKSGICKRIENHPKRQMFVAGHPIAGTENAGPSAAVDHLFNNKTVILCEQEKSSKASFDLVKNLYIKLVANIRLMDAEDHDRHMAYVSHLSHISSFALGLTVLDMEKNEKTIFDMAGSGFSSTVRLAKSSPEMWTPILEHNSEYLIPALEQYIDQLQDFKTFLKHKKTADIYQLMANANEIRRILKGDIQNG